MIYLSRLILNPRSRSVRRDLVNCQELHRTVLSAFPRVDGDARERFGVLFRLERPSRDTGDLVLLVQSGERPDWSRLPHDYLLPTDGDPPNPATKPLDAAYGALEAGASLRFRLRANPTRKIDTKSGPNGEKRNGRRVELRGEAAQHAWLRRKADDGGFRVLAVRGHADVPAAQATEAEKVTGFQTAENRDRSNRLTFGAVIFDGNLVVTNPERFRETLSQGIGSGKAYGFGLLSVAPSRG